MPKRAFPDELTAAYEIGALLGQGGFGAVYHARHRGLGREAVVKVLHAASHGDPQAVSRFLLEARIAARLDHPNVVRVLDVGTGDDPAAPAPWIAYAFVAGPSVAHALASGPFEPARAASTAAQVARALAAAHALGIVHRDVKPDNVLQVEPGRVALCDFGIALWVDGARVRTATGVILGTPAYLAPEVIEGGTASPASDQYALGVMLHEMLAGKPPYGQANLIELLQAHISAPVPDVAAGRPEVPRGLASAVARALAKEPEERFGSMEAFAQALEADGEAAPPAGVTVARRVAAPAVGITRRVDRKRPGATVSRLPTVVAGLAGALLGAAVLTLALRRSGDARPAVAPGPAVSSAVASAAPSPEPAPVLEKDPLEELHAIEAGYAADTGSRRADHLALWIHARRKLFAPDRPRPGATVFAAVAKLELEGRAFRLSLERPGLATPFDEGQLYQDVPGALAVSRVAWIAQLESDRGPELLTRDLRSIKIFAPRALDPIKERPQVLFNLRRLLAPAWGPSEPYPHVLVLKDLVAAALEDLANHRKEVDAILRTPTLDPAGLRGLSHLAILTRMLLPRILGREYATGLQLKLARTAHEVVSTLRVHLPHRVAAVRGALEAALSSPRADWLREYIAARDLHDAQSHEEEVRAYARAVIALEHQVAIKQGSMSEITRTELRSWLKLRGAIASVPGEAQAHPELAHLATPLLEGSWIPAAKLPAVVTGLTRGVTERPSPSKTPPDGGPR